MRGLWLFLHYMGFAAWLGGGLAMMLAGITAKHFPPEERLAVYRATGVVARNLVGPGALLVLAIGVVTPTAARMGRLELDPRGELPESFARLRKRQVIFATAAGVFALLALLAGTVMR